MDYKALLRALGCDENEIKEWEEILNATQKSFIILISIGMILIPIIFIVFLMNLDEYKNTLMIYYYLIMTFCLLTFLTGSYFIIKLNVNLNKFINMTRTRWLPYPNQYLFNSTPISIIYSAMSLEIFIILFICWIIFGHLFILLLGFLFVITPPLFIISIKIGEKKYGVSISRRFKADTDIIADKISLALNAEKKLVSKSQANKAYSIDLPLYSLKIWISRDVNRKDCTHISIRGVKEENLNFVKQIIEKIDRVISELEAG